MNRRAFLTGLFGTAAITALPVSAKVLEPTLTLGPDWQTAIAKVYANYMTDLMLYGTGAIRSCDTFPWIENVPLTQLYETPIGGLTTFLEGPQPSLRTQLPDAIWRKIN